MIELKEPFKTIKKYQDKKNERIKLLEKKLDRIGEIVKEHRDYYVIKSLVEEILKVK
jgi:hypothetical protein